MQSSSQPVHRLRTLLVLGRVSNLPTVWSNCLAAWLLAGGGSWPRFALLCAGATLLYVGGMFLNDAFDADFDRQHRRERPIPSGRIASRTVWTFGISFVLVGLLTCIPLGWNAVALAGALALAIVVYDAVHKRFALAPVLMSSCRFLLYLVAAAATQHGLGETVIWRALALALYVIGLSHLARGESTGGVAAAWPLAWLLSPIPLRFLTGAEPKAALTVIAAAILGAWILWCVRGGLFSAKRNFSSGVAGLLAGIVLVDWLAVAAKPQPIAFVFAGLFVLALILQRVAPAT